LLDGVVSVAAALIADLIEPGAAAWFAAGLPRCGRTAKS